MPDPILDTHKLIVGTSGGGKTTTARGELEQLLDDRRHVVVIDPMDVYFGERSDVAGTGPGYDIPIFGGRHGDVPIAAIDGDAIANIIVEQRISAIVSIKHLLDDGAQRAFLLAFLRRLRSKPPGNFHLLIDEAEEFCPQTAPDDVAWDLMRELTWYAKRGRSEGFVLTLITQRPADIAKAVISQAQTIIAHMLIDPRDRAAIAAYLKSIEDRRQRDEVIASLPTLQVGERWIYSPRLQILERGISPPIKTFDSSRTPAPGELRAEPRTLSQIDMTAIAAALARPSAVPADPEQAYHAGTEAGLTLLDRDRRIAELEARVAELEEENSAAIDDGVRCIDAIFRATEILKEALFAGKPTPNLHPADANLHSLAAETTPPTATVRRGGGAGIALSTSPKPSTVGRGRKALAVLVSAHPAGLTETQWAQLAGYARKGGTWSTYKGELRRADLIEQGGSLWYATPAGIAAIGDEVEPMPAPGEQLARHWGARVPGVRKMVEVLIKRWPHFTTRAALAADLGMAATGGTFGTYVGRLRANGLLDEQKQRLRLSDAIMGAASA